MKKKLIVAVAFFVAAVMTAFADVLPPRNVPQYEYVLWRDGISENICIFGGIAVIALMAVSFLLFLAVKRKLDFPGFMTTFYLVIALIIAWFLWGQVILKALGVPVGRYSTTSGVGGKVDHYRCHKCGGRTSEPGVGICRRCSGWEPEKCPKCGREMETEQGRAERFPSLRLGERCTGYCAHCNFYEWEKWEPEP